MTRKRPTRAKRPEGPKEPERIDLGHEHYATFYQWAPQDLPGNRKQYGVPLPRVERAGMVVYHPHKKRPGQTCAASMMFDLPELRKYPTAFPDRAVWQVVSWEPLTLTPSLLCLECGDHGFVRGGRWDPV